MTKIYPAQLYKRAVARSEAMRVQQEPRRFSTGSALMRPDDVSDERRSNMSVVDEVREVFSAQRRMLKQDMT